MILSSILSNFEIQTGEWQEDRPDMDGEKRKANRDKEAIVNAEMDGYKGNKIKGCVKNACWA